jgi:nucleoside-diphosphate kinase
MDQSVVLVKPDGVKRGLIGEIITRFEKAGIKIVAMKMVWINEEVGFKHYGVNDEWFEKVGEKTKIFYKENGLDKEENILDLPNKEIGKLVQKWNVDFLTEGPVVAILLEAPGVVPIVRKMVGATYPQDALPGTIRGDYSIESPFISNMNKRSVRNLIHASGNNEEAQIERELWFKESEIHDYKKVGE